MPDLTPRQALAALSLDVRAAWRTRYLADEGGEMRATAVLERAEAAMRAAGQEVTIRTLWIALADRVVGGDGDARAAAALAGFALGLRAG